MEVVLVRGAVMEKHLLTEENLLGMMKSFGPAAAFYIGRKVEKEGGDGKKSGPLHPPRQKWEEVSSGGMSSSGLTARGCFPAHRVPPIGTWIASISWSRFLTSEST